MNQLSPHHAGPRFKLGRILATPTAVDVLNRAQVSVVDLLCRHVRGDWGALSEAERQQNELAVETDARLLSSYVFQNGQTVWVITESDRSATTFLLPGDY